MADERPVPSRPQLWRPKDAGAAPTGNRTRAARRRTILAIVAVMLVLAGAILAFFFYPKRPPNCYFLDLWIDEYADTRIPLNAWSKPDRQALKDLPWQTTNAFTSQERRLLKQELDNLQHKADQPVVVFLCAYAAIRDSDGAVCLLPGDARLDEPKTWLPLTEILGYLKSCPAPHKLLLLDIMRPFTDASNAILSNDIAADAMKDLEAAVNQDKNLWVLCACAPGQVSLTSEDVGQSIFAYYVKAGLTGAAAQYGNAGVTDTRISVKELAAFTAAHVDRWAEQNRQTRQTPRLLGDGADFDLTVTSQSVSPSTSPPASKYPGWLLDGWKLQDDWWTTPGFPGRPKLVRQLHTALLQAEQQLQNGVPETKVQTRAQAQIDEFKRQWPVSAPAAQLAVKGKDGQEADDMLRHLRELTDQAALVQSSPKAQGKEKLDENKAAFLKRCEKPFDLAATIWQVAIQETSPSKQQIQFWTALLQSRKPAPQYPETDLLQRLAKIDADDKQWPAKAVHTALKIAQSAQATEINADEQTRPWLDPSLGAAHRNWKKALDLLVTPGKILPPESEPLLDETLRAYETANRHLTTLQDAFRLRDQALVFLQGHAAYLELDPQNLDVWENAVRKVRELQTYLDATPGKEPRQLDLFVKDLLDLESLERDLLSLRAVVDPVRIRLLIDQANQAGASDWRKMNAVLATPALPAKDRASLWLGWRSVGVRLNAATMQKDDPSNGLTPAPRPFDAKQAVMHEQLNGLNRARLSLGLLTLRGSADTHRVKRALDEATHNLANRNNWQDLNRELRQAWAKLLAGPVVSGHN